jgi:hypothetical protein
MHYRKIYDKHGKGKKGGSQNQNESQSFEFL